MSLPMKAGRLLNAVLTRFGYKMVIYDRRVGMTFTEEQLVRALSEMHGIYNRSIFEQEVPIDSESLKLLSQSMYTRFDTGFHLIACLRQSLPLPGDVCEFGVGQGVISALLAHEIRTTGKNLWLFDSFQGLGKPSDRDLRSRGAVNAGPAAERSREDCPFRHPWSEAGWIIFIFHRKGPVLSRGLSRRPSMGLTCRIASASPMLTLISMSRY